MKNDSQLAQELRAVTDAELNCPQPDLDLVEACVDTILELDGVEPETDEEVRDGIETVLNISAQQHMRKCRRIRRALIAAAAAVLIAAMSLSLMPLGTNDESLMHKWWPTLSQKEPGYRMDFGDYITLIKGGEGKEYHSIRKFVRETGADILVPNALPKGYKVRKVLVAYDYIMECPSVLFVMNVPANRSVTVYIGCVFDDLKAFERYEKIGNRFCGVALMGESCQGNFNDGGNGYVVKADCYDDLVSVIENMHNGSELYGQGK